MFPFGFLMFSGGIKWEQWPKMDLKWFKISIKECSKKKIF